MTLILSTRSDVRRRPDHEINVEFACDFSNFVIWMSLRVVNVYLKLSCKNSDCYCRNDAILVSVVSERTCADQWSRKSW